MILSLTLPWPPSANTYWRRNGNRYFISPKGMAYRKEVIALCCKYKGFFPKESRLRLEVIAFPPDNRRRDLDNIMKALQDSLEKAEVYVNDSQIDELIVRRHSERHGRVDVIIDDVFY